MKKFVKEYLTVTDGEHISDKVFMARITISITLIMLCLCALGATTYAHFTSNVTATGSITSSNYALAVTVDGVEIDANEAITLQAGSYTVQVEKKGSAKNGFCVVWIEGIEHPFVSCPLIDDVAGNNLHTMTFTLVLTEEREVTFEPHWGKSLDYEEYKDKGANREYYIANGNTVTANVYPQGSIDDSAEETEKQ